MRLAAFGVLAQVLSIDGHGAHDAVAVQRRPQLVAGLVQPACELGQAAGHAAFEEDAKADRKSTRLNSSHLVISYAVFCLKKKKHKTYCLHEAYLSCSVTYTPCL